MNEYRKNLVWFVSLIVTISFGLTAKDNGAGQPNVLFIVVDDLRTELGCYGEEPIESPNIDRLASEGTLFTRAYCNVPVCGASRASLLTGLRPTRNRFLTFHSKADEDAKGVTTLPEHFRNNGYYTISNGKVFHHDEDAAQSWDEIWHPASSSKSWKDYAIDENIIADSKSNVRTAVLEREVLCDDNYKDGKIAQKVINDLKKLQQSEQPFFLAAGFLKPHLPFNAPDKYWALYDGKVHLPDNDCPPENAPAESIHNFGELRAYKGIPAEGPVSKEMALKLIQGYYACVSYTDAQIGKILTELERLQLDKSTIVILWGDHGWNLLEHGLWCKHCNYENVLHAPLILKVPGKNQLNSTSEIVEFVDIYPTLCELAGLELPLHLQGSSFMKLLYDKEANSDGVAVCQWHEGITTVKDHYFYTEWINDDDSIYARMLYDHQLDPEENFNISEDIQNKLVIEEMSREMRNSRAPDYFH